MEEVFNMLKELNIKYMRFDQEHVTTCKESTEQLPKDLKGVRTKHLFLRDRKRNNYVLVVVDENKMIDLKALSNSLELKSLSMAGTDELWEYFKVEEGYLSMMSILNDKDKKVRFIIDKDIWEKEAYDCHPNAQDIVLVIDFEDWLKIFNYAGREPEIIHIPEKEVI